MKVTTQDGELERRILIGYITSTKFLKIVYTKYRKGIFRSRWSNLISEWCIKYFKKYHRAPKREIEALYTVFTKTDQDKESHKLIENFLASLSKEYDQSKKIDVNHLIDVATREANDVATDMLQEEIQAARKRGDVVKAVQLARDFREINFSSSKGIDLIGDISAHKQAFDLKRKILIKYDGGLGDFFGNELSEDSFVGIFGIMKGGKSYWLLDMAMRAMQQKRKVAYFQVGDLSQDQIVRRFQTRIMNRPLDCRTIQYPIGLYASNGPESPARVELERREYTKEVSWEMIEKRINHLTGKGKTDRLKLSWHPLGSISVLDIRRILEDWDNQGWTAQVCIIDYAENLAPNNTKQMKLDQVADTWATLRQISEARKCLVVTASQPKQSAFKSWVMTREHVSDSKMKLAHVSMFIGINQTVEEKEQKMQRLNCIVSRANDFSETKCCYTAGCLDMANPALLSVF